MVKLILYKIFKSESTHSSWRWKLQNILYLSVIATFILGVPCAQSLNETERACRLDVHHSRTVSSSHEPSTITAFLDRDSQTRRTLTAQRRLSSLPPLPQLQPISLVPQRQPPVHPPLPPIHSLVPPIQSLLPSVSSLLPQNNSLLPPIDSLLSLLDLQLPAVKQPLLPPMLPPLQPSLPLLQPSLPLLQPSLPPLQPPLPPLQPPLPPLQPLTQQPLPLQQKTILSSREYSTTTSPVNSETQTKTSSRRRRKSQYQSPHPQQSPLTKHQQSQSTKHINHQSSALLQPQSQAQLPQEQPLDLSPPRLQQAEAVLAQAVAMLGLQPGSGRELQRMPRDSNRDVVDFIDSLWIQGFNIQYYMKYPDTLPTAEVGLLQVLAKYAGLLQRSLDWVLPSQMHRQYEEFRTCLTRFLSLLLERIFISRIQGNLLDPLESLLKNF